MQNLVEVIANQLVEQAFAFQTVEFVSLKGYKTQNGKVADLLLRVGQTYASAKQHSIEELLALPVQGWPEEEAARKELIESWSGEVEPQRAEGQANAYTHLGRNFKTHNEQGTLHFCGIVQSEKVIEQGTYPVRKSRPKTITKNRLKKMTTIGKMRNLVIDPTTCKAIKFRGQELVIEF